VSTTTILLMSSGFHRKAWQENQTGSKRKCAVVLFIDRLRNGELLATAVCPKQRDTAITPTSQKSYVSCHNLTTVRCYWRVNSRSLVFRMYWKPYFVKKSEVISTI
jgi:hypothetical protein